MTERRHAAIDLLATFSHPASGGAAGSKPHAVSRIDVTGPVTTTQNFAYDAVGNTTCRPSGTAANTCPVGAGTQTLTWDSEGHLASSADSTGTTSYLYDADGGRLIRRDPSGSTLYLPGGTEVRKLTSSTATATRYYTHAGATIAVRTATSLHWLCSDHHNTAEAAISNADLSVAHRRTLPFGEPRGTSSGTWPSTMDKGFIGGTNDNTGLVHLGARKYDPRIGRFISVDPIVDHKDPQTLHGYAYSSNNPTTLSDPSGLSPNVCLEECGSKDDKVFQASLHKQHKKEMRERQRRRSFECRRMGECGQRQREIAPQPKKKDCWAWSWVCGAGRSVRDGYNNSMRWLDENWDAIYTGLIIAGAVVCVVASAGACAAVVAAGLIANVAMDGYRNEWDAGKMDIEGHLIDAAFVATGAGFARAAAGSWRATPYVFNEAAAATNLARTEVAGNLAWNALPSWGKPAGQYVTDFASAAVDVSPTATYAVGMAKHVVNDLNGTATAANMTNNFAIWAAFNGNDRY